MKAREALLESDVLGEDLKKIAPIIREGGSDTAIFDNVLEFLVMTGRSLPHLVRAFQLDDQARLLLDPELAAHRMRGLLAVGGFEH